LTKTLPRSDELCSPLRHIYSWFVHHYGRENVFMDFESIPSGARFADVISNEIRKCDALVVVIGLPTAFS